MLFEHLRYMIVLGEQGSINKAAEIVHISPQAMGTAIRNLEKRLDLDLFERTYHGVRLTAAGREIVEITRRYLEECAKLRDKYCLESEREVQQLRVAAVPYVVHNLLPQMLPKFYRLHPDIQLLIEEMDINTILDSLNSGEIEFALYIQLLSHKNQIIELHPDVCFEALMEGKLMAYVPVEWETAQYDSSIDLADVLKFPIIIPKREYLCAFLALNAENTSDIFNNATVENYYVMREMAEEGNCGILGIEWTKAAFCLTYDWQRIVPLNVHSDSVVQFGYLESKRRRVSPLTHTFLTFVRMQLNKSN